MLNWKPLKNLNTEIKYFGAILLVTQALISSILILVEGGITGTELKTILSYIFAFFLLESVVFVVYVRIKTPRDSKEINKVMSVENERLKGHIINKDQQIHNLESELSRFRESIEIHDFLVKENYSTIDIVDKEGKLAYVEKRQKLVCQQNNVESCLDLVGASGSVENYKSNHGTSTREIGDYGGQIKFVTEFREPLKKGQTLDRIVTMEFIDTFAEDEEFWQTTQHYPCEKEVVKIIFPEGRSYKKIRCIRVIGLKPIPTGISPEKSKQGTREVVKFELPLKTIDEKYRITWEWEKIT